MRWKKCLRLSLSAFCCLANLQFTYAFAASTTEAVSAEMEGATEAKIPEKWEYPRPCFVEKSKVDELIVQMNATVRILNRGDGNLQCQEKLEIKLVDAEDIEICSEERIQRIQKDLFKVAGSLFQPAFRLTEPSEEEVDFLHLIKFRLIQDLRALSVFYGSLPCGSYKIPLFPFQRLVNPVEESLNQIYSLFKSSRLTRLPPLATPATPTTTPKLTIDDLVSSKKSFTELIEMAELNPSAMTKIHDLSPITEAMATTSAPTTTTSEKPKPSLDDMLDPEKSFAELIQMAGMNPSAMSQALPKIVSQRYSRRASTFDSLLDFVNALPTAENKIFGFSAVYDEIHGHNQKPEEMQLEKLAKNVRHVIASVPITLNVDAKSKLDELAEDLDLRPLVFMFNPEKSLQELAEWAQSNPTAISIDLSEIISQRYNASDSQIEALLNFVEGLPTIEHKSIGFAALHDEIIRYGQEQTLNSAQLLKLAKKMKILNEDVQASSTFSNSATELKWTNLMRDLSPLMVIGEKAECHVINVAYGTQLTAFDNVSPQSAYVYQNQSWKATWQIYPAIQNYKLVFRITYWGDAPFFASDTNTNPYSNWANTIHQTKASERYLLWDLPSNLLTNAEIDWKFVAVPAKANQFRILSAKYDDFMFAHKSATDSNGYRRRVLLGKKSYSDHDYIANADIWTLDCEPGDFSIPSI